MSAKEEPYNCLACGHIGHDHGVLDECQQCNHQYNPAEEGEDCPECGCGLYDLTCPKCGAGGGDYAEISTMAGYVNKKTYRASQAKKPTAPTLEKTAPKTV